MLEELYISKCQKYLKWVLLILAAVCLLALAQAQVVYTNISQNDVRDKIENGNEVRYDYAIIDGSLNSYMLDLIESENGKKIINVPIFITNSIINDDVIFHDVIFNKPVYFLNTTFKDQCDFSYSIFDERADFTNAKFNRDVYFIYTRFINDAFFLSTIFSKDADFWEAYFGEDVDFGSARFNGTATFNFSAFRGDGYFNNAKFYKMLFLDRAKFSKLEIKFESVKGHLAYSENTYLKLIENFKSLGWFNDADDCYFYHRQVIQAEKGLGWSKLIDVFGWLSCGYGVRLNYTLWLIFILILCFGFIYWFSNGIRRSDAQDLTTNMSFLDALYYSAVVFVSQPPPIWHPNERIKYFILFEKITGWLLLALFIVTLGRIMIR